MPPYQAGGGEPGYIATDPKDPDVYFSGANNGSFLTRLNRRTGELREVGAYPRFFSGEASNEVKERWQWTYPIIFSPVDPNVLYTSSQRVWKTTNGGQTGTAISGDLTRHDPKTMGTSGGPITHDMNSPEIYGTVFSLGPGKTDVNVIWAGSDDGMMHVTRDGGKTWTNVTPKEMPDFGRVSQIDASSFDPGAAYIAVKKPLLDDFARRTSSERTTTGRRGRRSSPASARTTTRTTSARIRRARGSSTPARSTASTSRTTTAITGSRCR